MKRLFITSSFLFAAISLNAQISATVTNTGGSFLWNSADTWEDSTVPELDYTYNITFAPESGDTAKLCFNRAGDTSSRTIYVMDSPGVNNFEFYGTATGNPTVTRLDISAIESGNIYLYNYNDNSTYRNKITISSPINEGVNVYMNTSCSGFTSTHFHGNLYATYSEGGYESRIARLAGNGSVYIADNVYLLATQAATKNATGSGINLQSDSVLEVGEGATFEVTSGLKMQNGTINGALIVKGQQAGWTGATTNTFHFTMQKTVTFGQNATVDAQVSDSSLARALVAKGAKVYSYAGTGALKFAQALQISDSTLILNSQNAITNGDSKTKFLISKYVNDGQFDDATTTSTIKIGEAEDGSKLSVEKNTIAELQMYSNSVLNLYLNGNELEVMALSQIGDTSNKFSIVLNDAIDEGSFMVKDFAGLTTVEQVREYVFAGSESGMNVEVSYVNGVDSAGGFYISTMAIPEPAEFAALFGALALAFAARRRRR